MAYHWQDEIFSEQLADVQKLFDLNPVSQHRSIDDIKQMLSETDVIIAVSDQARRLLGVGRVLTDYRYKAWIFDVRIDPKQRLKGLGSELISRILRHPKLQRVESFDLICQPEHVGFYEKLGFFSILEERQYLRKNAKKA